MTERIVRPTGRGFLLLDAHPDGCAKGVAAMAGDVEPVSPARRPVALVIGSSAGYGLATTIAGLARPGIDGIGVGFERPPGRRTATAGWYRTITTAQVARDLGADMSFVNADAFADTTKDEVLDLVAKRFGGLDFLVYSVAAPRRTDPRIRADVPVGHQVARHGAHDQDPRVRRRGPARRARDHGGAGHRRGGGRDRRGDGRRRTGTAGSTRSPPRRLLNDGFRTVALTYIGSATDGGHLPQRHHRSREGAPRADRVRPGLTAWPRLAAARTPR